MESSRAVFPNAEERARLKIQNRVRKILRENDLLKSLANVTPERYFEAFADKHPGSVAIRALIDDNASVHFHGGLPEEREATFAAAIVGLASKWESVDVFDLARLTSQYYSKDSTERRQLPSGTNPIVVKAGDEIERKVGYFYFRHCIEQAAMHNRPVVIFTRDSKVAYRDWQYAARDPQHDIWEDLLKLANCRSVGLADGSVKLREPNPRWAGLLGR